MYSFYVLRRTSLPNNTDTVTDCYVLSDRAALLYELSAVEVDHRWTERCTVEVHVEGAISETIDVLATVPEDAVDDDTGVVTPDLNAFTIPALDGSLLPAGHPVVLDGEPVHYGCTVFYN